MCALHQMSYVERKFVFGDKTVRVLQSQAATTDYDLTGEVHAAER